MKTAVICHGYNLHSPNWQKVVWGIPEKDQMGRVPKAVFEVIINNAFMLILGTGSSEKDGIIEAEYTFQYLLDNFDNLKEFSSFGKLTLNEFYSFKQTINKIVITETESKNTGEELKNSLHICQAEGIERVIEVSSPSHAPRCIRDINLVIINNKLDFKSVYVTACDADFTSDRESVVIFEPHSGVIDNQNKSAGSVFGKYFSYVPIEKREEVLQKINEILLFGIKGPKT